MLSGPCGARRSKSRHPKPLSQEADCVYDSAMAFLKLDDLEEREIVPGYRARFVHSDNVTLAYWTIDEGAALPEHSHPHEQVANVLEGTFSLTVDGEAREVRPGDVAVIPGGVAHSGRAVTACRIVDVFHPVREDYR